MAPSQRRGSREEGYGLPPEQLKALAAAGSPATSTKDCSKLLATSLEVSAKALVEKRCGGIDALKSLIAKTPAASQADAMNKACKLQPPGDGERHDPWALLMSEIVAEELSLQPESTSDEKKIALALGYTCLAR